MKFKKNDILTIYFGLPGSGKTTVVSALAYKYLKAGYPVWSNVPIKGCYELNAKTDIGVFDVSCGLLIIDEAGGEYGNRNFKTNFTIEAMKWWRLHRHAGMSCVILSQSWDDADITFRRLAYRFYYVKKSLLPFFINVVPIRRSQGINDITKEPCTEYRFDHWLVRLFTNKKVFGPRYWKMFDSWDMPKLEKKEWKYWYTDNEKYQYITDKESSLKKLLHKFRKKKT